MSRFFFTFSEISQSLQKFKLLIREIEDSTHWMASAVRSDEEFRLQDEIEEAAKHTDCARPLDLSGYYLLHSNKYVEALELCYQIRALAIVLEYDKIACPQAVLEAWSDEEIDVIPRLAESIGQAVKRLLLILADIPEAHEALLMPERGQS